MVLSNSDVEADGALGRCAPSGPRSLIPVVRQTCDVADVAWTYIVGLNPPGEASLAEARVLCRGRIQSVAGDSFSAAARPAEAWCLDSLIGPCDLEYCSPGPSNEATRSRACHRVARQGARVFALSGEPASQGKSGVLSGT